MSAIDKLIYNSLVKYGNVNLPYVGSLEVVAKSAKNISKDRIAAPQKFVHFSKTKNKKFVSLLSLIIEQGCVDVEEASKIYSNWLSSTMNTNGGVLVIEEVGKISNGTFIPTQEFSRVIGIAKLPNVAVKCCRSRRLWCWIALAVVVIAAAAATIYFWPCIKNCFEDLINREEVVAVPEEVVIDEDQITEIIATTIIEEAQPIEHYVIVGSFADKNNALRKIKSDPMKIGAKNYKILPYEKNGENISIVSAYSSTCWNATVDMWRKLRKHDKTIWVYTK